MFQVAEYCLYLVDQQHLTKMLKIYSCKKKIRIIQCPKWAIPKKRMKIHAQRKMQAPPICQMVLFDPNIKEHVKFINDGYSRHTLQP